jgi:hypothetical protein
MDFPEKQNILIINNLVREYYWLSTKRYYIRIEVINTLLTLA